MQPLTKADILDKTAYEAERADLRRRVMVQKDRRRVQLGDHCTLLFESRETMHYQVQEMLRAEDSWGREGAVQDELQAYNPLIPGNGQLSATLMLEYETPEERALMLPRFVNLDRHLWLQIGDTARVAASFDRGQIDEDKISSVQYVRFALSDEQRRLLATEGTVTRLLLDHPAYEAQAVMSETTRRTIMHDPD